MIVVCFCDTISININVLIILVYVLFSFVFCVWILNETFLFNKHCHMKKRCMELCLRFAPICSVPIWVCSSEQCSVQYTSSALFEQKESSFTDLNKRLEHHQCASRQFCRWEKLTLHLIHFFHRIFLWPQKKLGGRFCILFKSCTKGRIYHYNFDELLLHSHKLREVWNIIYVRLKEERLTFVVSAVCLLICLSPLSSHPPKEGKKLKI